jgi:acyl-coenzyme A thioesterase PaaI-like protein
MNLRHFIWTTPLLSDKKRIECLPFFWLMRIKVLVLSPDWRTIKIRLPHSWIATNVGGSLFGGFQACLADPIAAMACQKLFPDHRVLTSSLQLDFRAQGLSDLELIFHMSPEIERQIRTDLAKKGRSTPTFEYAYYQEDGTLCTLIKAKVAIRSIADR